jgi:hypothetical protein
VPDDPGPMAGDGATLAPPNDVETVMRMMLKAVMDTQAGNEAMRNGSLGKIIGDMLGELKPEAAYFTTDGGQRCCIAVFDMSDTSQIPAMAEPLFVGMNAGITFSPCMNADDLQKGLEAASAASANI